MAVRGQQGALEFFDPVSDFEAHIHEIETYGYTVIKDVLTDAQCQQARATLLEASERFGEGHSHRTPQAKDGVGARHVANLPTMARCFHAFVDHPKILPLLEHFMGVSSHAIRRCL